MDQQQLLGLSGIRGVQDLGGFGLHLLLPLSQVLQRGLDLLSELNTVPHGQQHLLSLMDGRTKVQTR